MRMNYGLNCKISIFICIGVVFILWLELLIESFDECCREFKKCNISF